jgi:hypothetical protein
MADDQDLETFWQRVRPRTKRVEVVEWTLPKAIEGAVRKTQAKLAERVQHIEVDPLVRSRIAACAIDLFVNEWIEEVRRGDLSSLIGMVIEAKDLPIDELKAFVRSLPTTLLTRAVTAIGEKATGVEALLAIEETRRTGALGDYKLTRDSDGTLRVSFADPRSNGTPVEFRLDENFAGNVSVAV